MKKCFTRRIDRPIGQLGFRALYDGTYDGKSDFFKNNQFDEEHDSAETANSKDEEDIFKDDDE